MVLEFLPVTAKVIKLSSAYWKVEISVILGFTVPEFEGRRGDRPVSVNQGSRPVGPSKKQRRRVKPLPMRGTEADTAKAGDSHRRSSIAPAFHIIVLVSFCSCQELHPCNLSSLFSARNHQGSAESNHPCLGYLAGTIFPGVLLHLAMFQTLTPKYEYDLLKAHKSLIILLGRRWWPQRR